MSNSNLDIWIAGAVAAVTVDFIVYPFDTLKTRIQAPNYERLYKDAATKTIRRDVLFRGLYQGVWSVVFSTIPSSGAFFTTYEAIKRALTVTSTQTSSSNHPSTSSPIRHPLPAPVIHSISSCAAEMVSCFILTPAEVIKQNAQVVNLPHKTTRGGATTAQTTATMQALARFRQRPWKLWSGYTALVGRNLPFTGLHFPIMEYVRGRLVGWRSRHKAKTKKEQESDGQVIFERAALTAAASAVSGTVAAVVTTPIDVVKTRMMLSAGESDGATKQSSWAVGKQLFRQEGIRGLFRGGAIRSVWTASAMSIYLGMYEGGRFYLERRRRWKEGIRGEEGQSEGETAI